MRSILEVSSEQLRKFLYHNMKKVLALHFFFDGKLDNCDMLYINSLLSAMGGPVKSRRRCTSMNKITN